LIVRGNAGRVEGGPGDMAIKQVANPVAYSVPDLTKWSVVQWKEVPLKKISFFAGRLKKRGSEVV
jgi:hypothetical protein